MFSRSSSAALKLSVSLFLLIIFAILFRRTVPYHLMPYYLVVFHWLLVLIMLSVLGFVFFVLIDYFSFDDWGNKGGLGKI